jgi:hypothetical protein
LIFITLGESGCGRSPLIGQLAIAGTQSCVSDWNVRL